MTRRTLFAALLAPLLAPLVKLVGRKPTFDEQLKEHQIHFEAYQRHHAEMMERMYRDAEEYYFGEWRLPQEPV